MIPSKIAIGAFGLSMFSQGKADTETVESKGEARHRRVTPDEFSTIINDLSAASRLTAAVSLLNAIMDGKVTPNVALAELLNVGSVDVQKLETFKKENVENALNAIKNLQPNLSATAEGKKLEAMVILLEFWRQKFEEIGNVKDIELAKVYYSAVVKVQGKTLNCDVFHKSLGDFIMAFQNLLNPSQQSQNDDNLGRLNQLIKAVDFAEKFAGKQSDCLTSLQQFDDLTRRDFIEDSPQRKFMDLLKNVENTKAAIVTSDTAAQTELSGFVGKVNQELPGSLATDLFHLAEVVSTQSHLKRVSSKTFTAALPNGYLDLDKLDGDVTNPTVKPLLSGFDETTLKNGFAPLKALTSDAADLHQSWSSLNETANVAAGKDLDKLTRWFGAFKANNTATAVKNVGSYGDTAIPSFVFSNTFGTSLDKSIKLRSTLLNVRQKAELLQKDPLMNDLKKFSEMKQYLPTTQLTNVTQVSAALTQFKKFNGSAELLTTLQSLKSHVQSISSDLTNLDLTNTITNLAGGQQALNDFVGHSDLGAVTTYFSGLKGMSAEVESLAGMVQMIKEIRIFSDAQTFTSKLLLMAGVVVSSVPKVSVLINVASKINDDANVAKLKKLKDLEDPAKQLGESVLALKNIERVLERKNEFAELLNRSKDVKGLFAAVDPARKPVLTTAWGDIDETEKKVNMTMADLENRINNLPMPTISKFADYGPVFSAFANLRDLNLESKTRLEVLEELVITQPTVSDVKSKFENLQSLDLHFARSTRPLGTVSSSLASLDNIFFAAAQVPVVVTAPPAPVPTASPQTTKGTTLETTTPPTSWGMWLGIGGFVFVVFVGGIITVIVWRVFSKPKKSEKDVDLESGVKDGQATATSTPSGCKVDDASTSELESGVEKERVTEGKKEGVKGKKDEEKDEENDGNDKKKKEKRNRKAKKAKKNLKKDESGSETGWLGCFPKTKKKNGKPPKPMQAAPSVAPSLMPELPVNTPTKSATPEQTRTGTPQGKTSGTPNATKSTTPTTITPTTTTATQANSPAPTGVSTAPKQSGSATTSASAENQGAARRVAVVQPPAPQPAMANPNHQINSDDEDSETENHFADLPEDCPVQGGALEPVEGNDSARNKKSSLEAKRLQDDFGNIREGERLINSLSILKTGELFYVHEFYFKFFEKFFANVEYNPREECKNITAVRGKPFRKQLFNGYAQHPVVDNRNVSYLVNATNPQLPLIKSTAVKDLHANYMAGTKIGLFIVGEGPNQRTKLPFIKHVYGTKIARIVMCGPDSDSVSYYGDKTGDKVLVGGQYELETMEKRIEFDGHVIRRKIKLTDKKSKAGVHTVVHYQFARWKRGRFFNLNEVLCHFFKAFRWVYMEIIMDCNKIFVHSTNGTGRAAMFVGVPLMYQYVLSHKNPDCGTLITYMRSCRNGAVENGRQFFFIGLVAVSWFNYDCLPNYPFVVREEFLKQCKYLRRWNLTDALDNEDWKVYDLALIVEQIKTDQDGGGLSDRSGSAQRQRNKKRDEPGMPKASTSSAGSASSASSNNLAISASSAGSSSSKAPKGEPVLPDENKGSGNEIDMISYSGKAQTVSKKSKKPITSASSSGSNAPGGAVENGGEDLLQLNDDDDLASSGKMQKMNSRNSKGSNPPKGT